MGSNLRDMDLAMRSPLQILLSPLSARARNGILRSGITNFAEFMALKREDLESIRNLGVTSITEIMNFQHDLKHAKVSKIYVPSAGKPKVQTAEHVLNFDKVTPGSPQQCPPQVIAQETAELYSAYNRKFQKHASGPIAIDKNTLKMINQGTIVVGVHLDTLTIFQLYELARTRTQMVVGLSEVIRGIDKFFDENKVFPNTMGLIIGTSLGEQNTRARMRKMFEALYGQRAWSITSGRTEGKTLKDLGDQYGITRERVRQILNRLGEDSKRIIEWVAQETAATRAKQSEEARSVLESRITEFIARFGAVSINELAAEFGLSEEEVPRIVPKNLRRFLITEPVHGVFDSKWSREQTLNSVRKAGTYYFPLTSARYQYLIDIGEVDGPSVAHIFSKHGSWTTICVEAGIEAGLPLRENYESLWSETELLQYVVRYLQDPHIDGTARGYQNWVRQQVDHVPSFSTIQKAFGNWSTARMKALLDIRREASKKS